MLTMTHNSTRYHQVRRALRSLFAADGEFDTDLRGGPKRTVWFHDDWQEAQWEDDGQDEWFEDEEAYWTSDGWLEDGWNDETWNAWDTDGWWPESPTMSGTSTTPLGDGATSSDAGGPQADSAEEVRFAEAYTLAMEANKTLTEARKQLPKFEQHVATMMLVA